MVLLCFGSYFAGIGRNRANSDKIAAFRRSDATRITHGASRITSQCDLAVRPSLTQFKPEQCDSHPTWCESHHLLPPEQNRAWFEILIWPVAYLKSSPDRILMNSFITHSTSDPDHIRERIESKRRGSFGDCLERKVEKCKKIKISPIELHLSQLIMIPLFFISFTLSSIMYE